MEIVGDAVVDGLETVSTSLAVSNLTIDGMLYIATGNIITSTAAATNGQLLIGSTGAVPVLATLTAGTGITVTNTAGTITIAATGGASGTAGQAASVSVATGTTTSIMNTLTAPTNAQGTQFGTLTVTPKSTSSKFRLDFSAYVDAANNAREAVVAVFRGATLVAATITNIATSGRPTNVVLSCTDSPATAAAVTYTVRVGVGGTATTISVNVDNAGTLNFGGTANVSAFSYLETL